MMRWPPASTRRPGWSRSAEGTLAELPRKVRSNIVLPVLSVVAASCHGALKQSIDENRLSLQDIPSRVGDTEPSRALDLLKGPTAPRTRRPFHLEGIAADERGIPIALDGLHASPPTPKNSTIKNRGPLLSFLCAVGTQSYDEFTTAVPLRPRLSMMLGMVNTSDIFWIGEHASACSRRVAG